MKLKKAPLILLAIAALLGGGVYWYETQTAPKQEASQETSAPLFSFKESDVKAFTLKTAQENFSFSKTEIPPASSGNTALTWKMVAPEIAPANDASISYLLNLLATAKSEKPLKIPTARQSEFGFDPPLATIDITLNDQKNHRLVLGKPDFNRTFLYAQVDPPTTPTPDITVSLVPLEFENAVKRPLAEWKVTPPQPPKQPVKQPINKPTPPSSPKPK